MIRIRKDIFASPTKHPKTTTNQPNTTNWHLPKDGVNYELWKKETQPHVRQLFTESIPFGRSENTALDSKAQLGYDGDFDDTETETEEEVSSAKRRKVYYEDKIGGRITASPSYKYYSPVSPLYSPTWTEMPTLSYNPFKSDDETDDEYYGKEKNYLVRIN